MFPGPDLRDGLIRKRMERIGRALLFASGKGGVGKSTLSAASALLLSAGGSVGVLDLDLHGPSIPLLFGVRDGSFRESRNGLVPSRAGAIPIMSVEMFARGRGMPLRGAGKSEMIRDLMAITDFGALDTLVVDMPPGTGDELMTAIEMFGQRSSLIFVTRPNSISWNVTRRAVQISREMRADIAGVVQNMGAPSGAIERECSAMGVRNLGCISYHRSVEDRTVSTLRGSEFMRELEHVLHSSGLL